MIEDRLQEIADDYHERGIVDSDGLVYLPEEELEQVRAEFSEYFDENPDLIEEANGYMDYCAAQYLVAHPPCLRRPSSSSTRRARARCSHRVVRAVAKTAGGDSGDGDPEPEPPSDRRALTIGGAP